MSNLELIMNPYISPVYISATNIVTPVATITFDRFYTSALVFGNLVLTTLQIFTQTAGFIMKEGLTEFFAILTVEKIVYILVIYNIFMMLVIDNERRNFAEQKEVVEALNKEVNYFKKSERIREDLDELWLQDVKKYHKETSNKVATMEKKIKKLEKVLKEHYE